VNALGVAVTEAPGVGEGDRLKVYGIEFGEGEGAVVGAEGDQAGHSQAVVPFAPMTRPVLKGIGDKEQRPLTEPPAD